MSQCRGNEWSCHLGLEGGGGGGGGGGERGDGETEGVKEGGRMESGWEDEGKKGEYRNKDHWSTRNEFIPSTLSVFIFKLWENGEVADNSEYCNTTVH